MSNPIVPIDRAITYTHTAPGGTVVVVTNVPAEVYLDPEGREEILYRIDVAARLDNAIRAKLANVVPGSLNFLSYNDGPAEKPALPDADYTLKFDGPDENVPHPTIQTWRLVVDKAYTAFKIAAKSVTEKASAVAFPSVVFFARASIIVGVRTTEQGRLFEMDYERSDIADKTLQLLMDTSLWLDGQGELPAEIADDPAAVEKLLRAVEELSPTDAKTTVVLQKFGHPQGANFNREKREVARQKRIEIRLTSSQTSRPLQLIGRIANLDVLGKVTLRDIEKSPLWQWKTATCTFESDLLPTLLENFGHRVIVSTIQEKEPKNWSRHPEVLDVVRPQPAPETNIAAEP
jgi:hypothetical protein